jgi:cytochrome P450
MSDEAEQMLMSLFAPGGAADPYPAFAKVRELSPVHHSPGLGAWVFTRFADCQQVLADGQNFLVQDEAWRDANMPGWRESFAARFMSALLVWRNAPDHTRLRRLLTRDFTVRRVEALRPTVQRTVDDVLDRLAAGGAGNATVDLVTEVFYPLANTVIGQLVGVPREDHERLQQLTQTIGRLLDPQTDPATVQLGDQAAVEYRNYFRDLVRARRADPRDDLTSALVAKHEEHGDQLSDDEVIDSLVLLFAAGFETTAGVLGNGTSALLGERAQYERLVDDPSLAASATEEILRWDTSVQLIFRYAVKESEIGGTTIPANAVVAVLNGAANRDPARFSDPDRFDITRDEGRPLSFGHGIHMCIGAALARLEMTLLLTTLATRFPKLAPAGALVRRPAWVLRGLTSLPVVLNG